MPGDAECTTAKPRGTQVSTCEFEIPGRDPGVRRRLVFLRRRLGPDLLPRIPEELLVPRGPGEVGAGLVDDRDLQPFRVGLVRAGLPHVHAVGLAVPVGVELGLDPEVVLDPPGGVLKGLDDLGLAVLEDRPGPPRFLRLRAPKTKGVSRRAHVRVVVLFARKDLPICVIGITMVGPFLMS